MARAPLSCTASASATNQLKDNPMNLNNELHQLTGRAEAYLKYQEDLSLAEKLQDRLGRSEGRRRPVSFSNVVFHGEGLETIAGGRVDITPSFTLPAREVSWDFADAELRD